MGCTRALTTPIVLTAPPRHPQVTMPDPGSVSARSPSTPALPETRHIAVRPLDSAFERRGGALPIPVTVRGSDGSRRLLLNVERALERLSSDGNRVNDQALGALGELVAAHLLPGLTIPGMGRVTSVTPNPYHQGTDAILHMADLGTVPFEMKTTRAADPRAPLVAPGKAGGYRQGASEYAAYQAARSLSVPARSVAEREWQDAQGPLLAEPEPAVFGVLHIPTASVYLYVRRGGAYVEVARLPIGAATDSPR